MFAQTSVTMYFRTYHGPKPVDVFVYHMPDGQYQSTASLPNGALFVGHMAETRIEAFQDLCAGLWEYMSLKYDLPVVKADLPALTPTDPQR